MKHEAQQTIRIFLRRFANVIRRYDARSDEKRQEISSLAAACREASKTTVLEAEGTQKEDKSAETKFASPSIGLRTEQVSAKHRR